MNVWTIQPRCSSCRARLERDVAREHKFSCSRSRGWSELAFLPRRDPGRSIRRPDRAHWPQERKQFRMKATTGRMLPAQTIVHCGPNLHIFNGSDHTVYVEVTDDGELRVKAPKTGPTMLVVKMEP